MSSSAGEERLNEIIAAYLEAVDAGRPPDRQELLRQHPDLAAELEAFFADRDAFDRLAPRAQPADMPTITPSEQPAPAPGVKVRYFGDYELLQEIARGGMGVVYRARQLSLNRLVALKMILAGQLASEADVQRFHAEAEAAAHLDHPNIVPIYEVGQHEGNHYYAMQFVDGPSLAKYLDGAKLSNRDAAELIRTSALAVQYAHDRGVIHRDLKPANILLTFSGAAAPLSERPLNDCTPKLTDFGLAKRLGQGASLTATGEIVGTPSYMAPEQASNRKTVGPGADVYSLGAILYEMLTGRPPFRAATPLDTILQVVADEPVPPSHLQPKVPRDLETICLKCLEKQPERRYGSARELAEDLDRFLKYEPIHARPVSRTRRFGVWVRKRPWVVVALALLAILGVSLLAQSFYLENRRQRWESLFREAQIGWLSLARQEAPRAGVGEPLRPAAERALQSLRQAATLRPESRLYAEALDVLLVERRGGQHVYPKPGTNVVLPREWALDDHEFPWPFTLTSDAKLIQLPGILFHLDTGATTRLEEPLALQTSLDPTGTLLARLAKGTALEVVERTTGKPRLLINPQPLAVLTWRFSVDGRLLAVVTGNPFAHFSPWNTRTLENWANRALEIWEVSTSHRVTSIRLPDRNWPTRPEFSGDSRFVAWIAPDEVRVYAVANGELTGRIAAPGVQGAALSPDGATLAWSRGVSGKATDTKVTVVKVSAGEPIRELRSTGPVAVVRTAYTPDGKFIIGQAGFCARDAIYSSFGRMDKNLAPVFRDHTNRVCIWSAADGKLLAWLPGRAFADGFGPRGDLAIARTRGSGADADLEIDLWRPTDLIEALGQEGLSGWMEFSNQQSQGGSVMAAWLFWISIAEMILASSWFGGTVQRIQKKRITTRRAHAGITLTLLLVGSGVLCFMAAVAEFAGHWDQIVQLDSDHLYGILCALWGFVSFSLAILTGPLAIKCYTHATYGEAVLYFELLQAVPEEDQNRDEQRAKQFNRAFWRWLVGCLLGFGVVFGAVAYFDGSIFLLLLTRSWDNGLLAGLGALVTFFGMTASLLLFSLLALLLPYVLLALIEAKWGPAKQPWFVLPAGIEVPRLTRFLAHVYNLFPLGRMATIAFWLVVLLAGLGIAAFELYTRLASGKWPRSFETPSADVVSTGLLGLALFYVLVSVLRLVRIARLRQQGASDH
jgi:serine/threonine protein kinase